MNLSKTEQIKRKAIDLGFDLVGITDAAALNTRQVELLTGWLKSGFAGQMNYIHRNFEKRIDPAKLLKNARSLICVGLNYTPPKPSASLRVRLRQTPTVIATSEATKKSHLRRTTDPTGRVANFAQYEDYHLFIKKRLRELIDFISFIASTGVRFKICVDSVPLTERAFAARAGLGFIGKNHMLINPELGCQIFLGEIITSLKLQSDKPISCHPERTLCHSERTLRHSERTLCHSERSEESIDLITAKCSNCNKCINACPTGALRHDGQFDANKCISYLTIEYKGRIPRNLAEKIGDRLLGCDECVLACPYQQDAPVCKNKEFKFYSDRAKLNLHRILNLTQQNFDAEFADSPIRRLGLERLKRNAQICLANITKT